MFVAEDILRALAATSDPVGQLGCPSASSPGEPRGQDIAQGTARGDFELGEDLPQVPFDRARAEEELGPDLGV